MQYLGIIIHHSVCPSINGKGYDFFLASDGNVFPAPLKTDPQYVHICLEGDFSDPNHSMSPNVQEQLFVLSKLMLRLSETFGFTPDQIFSHTDTCPGSHFPWSKLVISAKDGYH